MSDHSYLAQPGPFGLYSDAARRLSDAVNLHLTVHGADAAGQWIAARLTDGGTDGNLYPSKSDAVRHRLAGTENHYAYVRITPDGMSAREAEIYLQFNRKLHDNGYRMPDPAHHIHMPQTSQLGDYR